MENLSQVGEQHLSVLYDSLYLLLGTMLLISVILTYIGLIYMYIVGQSMIEVTSWMYTQIA